MKDTGFIESKEEAREAGREMARKTARKLKPYTDAVVKAINDACDNCEQRIREDEHTKSVKAIIDLIERNCKDYEDRTVGTLLNGTFWQGLKRGTR